MSTFDTPWFSSDHSFFDKLNISRNKHVIISGENQAFAQEIISQWQSSGFTPHYVAYRQSGNDFVERIQQVAEEIADRESYALVAFGEAATTILQTYTRPRSPRLVAIVAYYPSWIPEPSTTFPASLRVLVHLAGDEVDVNHSQEEVLDSRSQQDESVKKRIDSGIGYGGCLRLGFKTYAYEDCEPGFAEHHLDQYDSIAQDVAFSRSLALLKLAFRVVEDNDLVRDDITQAAAQGNNAEAIKSIAKAGTLINVPSLTGGFGVGAIKGYYDQIFHPLPASFTAKLVSRTIGSDRVVDEMLISFIHSRPIPWLLPGLPATNRRAEIVFVSIACIRGGLLVKEHAYWDQASLLMQIGLLDPAVVPDHWKKHGVHRLPIVGAEGARAIRTGSTKMLNSMIRGQAAS